MAGLQGSGKTTACAKLAKPARQGRQEALALAACDTQRPAAVEQLVTLGERAGATVYQQGTERDPVDIAEWALGQAKAAGDGRPDRRHGRPPARRRELMDELAADPEAHQAARRPARRRRDDRPGRRQRRRGFAERADFDGVVMTKLDGDARGGAALSVKAVTGKPILYASTGEKLERARALPPGADGGAHPRHGRRAVADREGRGGLGRTTRRRSSSARSASSSSRSRTSSSRCSRSARWARSSNLMGMMPGMGKAMKETAPADMDERELDRVEAIILSMTPDERAQPDADRRLAPEADRAAAPAPPSRP